MKKKYILLLICALGISVMSMAQTAANVGTTTNRSAIVDTSFPLVNAKTLLGNMIVFPTVVKNKICIVSVAFNDEGQVKLDTWLKAIPAKFTDSTIVFYEMPMIKNAPKLFRGFIERGMRKKIDPKMHDHVVNYYGSIKAYQEKLLMSDENSCYTFLLDQNGIILFSVEGAATDESLEQMDLLIKKMAK